MSRFVFFGTLAVCVAFAVVSAGPLGSREDPSTTPAATTADGSVSATAAPSETTELAVVDTLNVGDENSTDLTANGNETHIRNKRSCGCCCCRPCCCCCRPCCCCCRCCCCCCCRCCCRCCCCRPCCCCCRPCCGCCGCGGGRKRRSIQQLTHKLMDKQAAIIRESAESTEVTTTTEAPTPAPFTNANIDAYGRSYGNIAFADLNSYYQVPQNLPQYQYQDEQQLN